MTNKPGVSTVQEAKERQLSDIQMDLIRRYAATKTNAEIRLMFEETAQPAAVREARDWVKIECFVDEFVHDYEMVGETQDGQDACYQPNDNDRALLRDCIAGLLSEPKFLAMLASTTPAVQNVLPNHPDVDLSGFLAQAANSVAEQDTDLDARNDLLDELEDTRLELLAYHGTHASIIGKAIDWINGESTAPAAPTEPKICGVCSESRPFTGTCGGGRDNPRALCFEVEQVAPKANQDDWCIDNSAGRQILVYKNCSVIEAEQAHYVMGLIVAEQSNGTPVADAEDAARYRWLREQDDRSACFVVYGRNGQWGECGHCEIYGDLLDETIDAARDVQQKGNS